MDNLKKNFIINFYKFFIKILNINFIFLIYKIKFLIINKKNKILILIIKYKNKILILIIEY